MNATIVMKPSLLKQILVLVGVFTSIVICNGQGEEAFRDLAPPGLYVGSVFHGYSDTWQEPDYQALALENFNIMTSSIYLPTVWQGPSEPINVAPFAEAAKLLKDNNILVHGHSLLYPAIATLTDWWNDQPTEEVEDNMYTYMAAVAEAGRDCVFSWDVLNEVMGDDNNDMDEDGVRRSLFNGKAIKEYEAMGQNYTRKAFTFARQLDPSAKLMLTEYGCEEDFLDDDNEKSDRLYRFVSKLLDEGIPIDGIGFQVHVGSEGSNPDYLAIARNFERFRKLGLLIYITEMDVVSFSTLNPESVVPSAELQRAARFQGRVYRRILEVCMAEPACQSFRFWDFAEYNSRVPELRYSWLHPITHDPNRFGVYTYPTPFWDINPENLRPKSAWREMREAMKGFSENEGGIYRITSNWNAINSYIVRDGDLNENGGYEPGRTLQLHALDENSRQWSSMKWRLERLVGTTNIYHIQCLWAHGYLTRTGEQNSEGEWFPTAGLRVDDLDLDWWSQRWVVDYNEDNTYTIKSYWGNENDYLTRLGVQDATGGYQATNEIRLQDYNQYSSQHWYLERTL
mmetsp:Transcript_12547/g.20893  ORF Transcript_12547/g.20893 Transcript_12547/m.20893 type:complete len:569 (+) Transcript_12547:11-1717(+)